MRSIPAYRQLSREDETALVLRAQAGDTRARDDLVRRNLRLVLTVARRFKGYHVEHEELVQEGNFGLVRAVQRFDTTRGVRFVTCAVLSIRGAMFKFVLNNALPIRMPANEKSRSFWHMAHTRARLGPDATTDEILADMNRGKKTQTTRASFDIMAPLLTKGAFVSTDETTDDGLASVTPLAREPNPEELFAAAEANGIGCDRLAQAMACLSERDHAVIVRRFLIEDTQSLEAIGEAVGVTRERVRQIELMALHRLRRAMDALEERAA